MSFDVTELLSTANAVTFDLTEENVPEPLEGSVRPQLVMLGVARAPLTLRGVLATAGAGFTFSWSGSSANTYTVEYSTDLSVPNGWQALPGYEAVPGVDGPMTCVDPAGGPARFYRVIRR